MIDPLFHRRFITRILSHLMRVFFSLLYHQFSWAYDLVANLVSFGKWVVWIEEIITEIDGPRVLELGSGPGHLQEMLGNKGLNHTGIDESPQMVKQAAKRIRKMTGKTHIIRGYAQSLPFLGETFHQVAATFPSEYILDPFTIAEAFRVLLPGGKLVVLPGVWITGETWIERITAWLYKVTGQSFTWNDSYLIPFRHAGFIVEHKFIVEKAWTLLVILAVKPDIRG